MQSIPGVIDVEVLRGTACRAEVPSLVVEVPHGATDAADYDAVHRRMRGALPERLVEFFFVNTDVGAYELGRRVAERVVAARPECSAAVLRCRIPRTFIDTNRILDEGVELSHGITAGIPPYVRDASDIEMLRSLHDHYENAVAPVFETVCGAGGLGLLPHTYAPREVDIDGVDDEIVTKLNAAYEPAVFAQWPLRPEIDLIVRTEDGTELAPPGIVGELVSGYESAGFGVQIGGSYYLHPATTGFVRSERYPGRITGLEVRRDLLVEEFLPFAPMRVDAAKVDRAAGPLADALAARLG